MRVVLLILALQLVAPVHAQIWEGYQDVRFGFSIDIPPGFAAGATNDDGRTFTAAGGSQVLTVRGGGVLPGSFDDVWRDTQSSYGDAGWTLRYEPTPPNWTSFVGARGGRLLYVKMIPLCGGTKQYAMFAFEYPEEDATALDPTIEHLAASLKATSTGLSC
jgi:hypothetical protein